VPLGSTRCIRTLLRVRTVRKASGLIKRGYRPVITAKNARLANIQWIVAKRHHVQNIVVLEKPRTTVNQLAKTVQ
jgi:hypothetical protein